MTDCQPVYEEDSLLELSEARRKTVARLKRIEGHVRGIARMVEEDRPCAELLIQLGAVRAAVDAVSRIVLENHVERCLRRAVEDGSTDEVWAPLREALNRYIGP